ncbi:hypothetical protein TNCV_2283761 [Trichonephila clavipes]|nr:hypothetical protein TNCV_2283761 [Trichonephila clavipes]
MGRSYRRINDRAVPNMCNYSPTNKASKSKTGLRKPFSNHLPRRQCSPLDRLRLLSMGAGTPMSIMIFSQSVVMDPRTNNK